MRYPKYLIPLGSTTFLIVSIDQMWKYIMTNILVYGDSLPVIKKCFALTLVFNTGAAFGIFPDKKILFLILPVLTVILILVLFIRSKNRQELVLPLALLLGGTIGNFIDRVCHGYVIDFFDLYCHTYHWPAFNFADASICMGIVMLGWKMVRRNASNSS